MTAPNSPSPAAKAVTAPARMPGDISGRVTVTKRSSRPAPRVRAAASSPGSTPSSPSRTARTISGKDITAVASAAPPVVKTRRMPNQSCSGPPIGPRRPNSISRPQPTTTGGTTSGRCTSASSSDRPGKRPRASSMATPMRRHQRDADGAEGDIEAEPDGLPFLGGQPELHAIPLGGAVSQRT